MQSNNEPGTLSGSILCNMKRGDALLRQEVLLEALQVQLAEKRVLQARRRQQRRLVKEKQRFVETLRQEQRHIQTLASLRLMGRASTWYDLKLDQRWNKQVVLAILSCPRNTDRLPVPLTESSWMEYKKEPRNESNKAMKHLCQDLDVFVARVRRPEFISYHSDNSKRDWLGNFSPHDLLEYFSLSETSANLLTSLIPRVPEVFLRTFYYQECQWNDAACEYLRSCPREKRTNQDAKFFWNRLSADLRKDLNLMLLTLETFPEMEELPGDLKDDCEFAKALARRLGGTVGDRLAQFTDKVRNDYDVAWAFCKANGSSYKHVSFKLRIKHESLARLACETCPSLILSHIPGCIERKLTKNKTFCLCLLNAGNIAPISPTLYQILSPTLKQDPDMVVAAVKGGLLGLTQVPRQLQDFVRDELIQSSMFVLANLRPSNGLPSSPESTLAMTAISQDRSMAIEALDGAHMSTEDVPVHWFFDPDFWGSVLSSRPGLWAECPFVGSIGFAKNLLSPSQYLAKNILHDMPALCSDVEFWRGLMDREDLSELVAEHASNNVRRDKDTMRRAVARDYKVYDSLPEFLKGDREILETLLSTQNSQVLFSLPFEVRLAHPDLVIRAMKLVSTSHLLKIYSELFQEEEWSNQDIARVWLSMGGEWLKEFPDEFMENEELMLLIAKNNGEWFHVASGSLRKNKRFVLQALRENGMTYRYIDDSLKHDFDVVLSAWGANAEVGDSFFAREDYRFVIGFASTVRAKLRDYDVFVKTVLCGTSSKASCESPLKNLLFNLGLETSMEFRKRLAGLLGIPPGRELTTLRNASKNLEQWGY